MIVTHLHTNQNERFQEEKKKNILRQKIDFDCIFRQYQTFRPILFALFRKFLIFFLSL